MIFAFQIMKHLVIRFIILLFILWNTETVFVQVRRVNACSHLV